MALGSDKTLLQSQEFCLRWNNYQKNATTLFDALRNEEEFVDLTLCAEGKKLKAHRMMMSACSPYFREVLKDTPSQYPVFFMNGICFEDLAAIVEFVYKGEVNVTQSQLGSFLKTAELLQVKGLSGDEQSEDESTSTPVKKSSPLLPLPVKRLNDSSSSRAKRVHMDHGSQSRFGSYLDSTINESVTAKTNNTSHHEGTSNQVSPETSPVIKAEDLVKVEAVEFCDMVNAGDDDSGHDATQDEKINENTVYIRDPLFTQQLDEGTGSGVSTPEVIGTSDDDTQMGRYRCEECGMRFVKKNAIYHHRKVHKGATTCPACGKVFSKVEHMKRHLVFSCRATR